MGCSEVPEREEAPGNTKNALNVKKAPVVMTGAFFF